MPQPRALHVLAVMASISIIGMAAMGVLLFDVPHAQTTRPPQSDFQLVEKMPQQQEMRVLKKFRYAWNNEWLDAILIEVISTHECFLVSTRTTANVNGFAVTTAKCPQ